MPKPGSDAARKERRRTLQDEVTEVTRKKLGTAFFKLLPFGAQVVASAAAYTVGITTTQLLGFVCRVSCATPVLGPAMGLIGVGVANALAGQASKHTRKLLTQGGNPLAPGFWEPLDVDDVVLDAVLGVFIFKAMGGRFGSVMPSDISKPGALAFESIPARPDHSEAYAQPSVRRELARIFKRDGCHHCGSFRGPVIGDHMPPNKLLAVKKGAAGVGNMLAELPGIGKVCEMMGVAGRPVRALQRFYPQCQRCSIRQASALRTGKRVLVLHLQAPGHRQEWLAGVFVGVRHNIPPVFPAASTAADRLDIRRQSGKRNCLALTAEAPAEEEGSSGYGHAPQLLVQELRPSAWELGLQGMGPATAELGPAASHTHMGGSRQHSNAGSGGGGYLAAQQQQQQQRQHQHQHLQHLQQQPYYSKPSAAAGVCVGPLQQQLKGLAGEEAGPDSREGSGDRMAAAAAGSLTMTEQAKYRAEQVFDRHFGHSHARC